MELQREELGKLPQQGLHDGPHRFTTRPEESCLHTRVGLRHDDAARREEIESISQEEHHVVLNSGNLCAGERCDAFPFFKLPSSPADGEVKLRILSQSRAR